jgi:type VI secretion system protein ImpH
MSGSRVWQRDLRMRLEIGPMKRSSFDSFLPGGKAARALKSMLTMFTGVTLEYEVQLVLAAADVQSASLADDRSGGRLGWDTFLVSEPQTQDRQDVRYEIHAL